MSAVARMTWTAMLVFVGSYAGALVGTVAVFPELRAAILFPPYAVLAASLMLSPVRQWWLYVVASAVGNFWPHLHHEGLTSFVLSTELANCARGLIAAAGVRWLGERAGLFETFRGTVVFLAFAVIVGPIIGALIGATSVVARNARADFWMVWQAWLLSNILTGLTLLPLILIIAAGRPVQLLIVSFARLVESLTLSIAIVCVGAYIFTLHHVGMAPAILYAPLPLLLWVAVRFGPGGAILALSTLASCAIGGAIFGGGPFVTQSPAEDLIQLQYFLIALCTPILLLAALVRERTRTASALQQSQADYRAVVEDQTELICRFLADGTYTFVNGAYCRYFQRSREELLGRTFWEFIPPEAHESARAHLATITPDHPVATIEHEVIAPGGEIRWQQWTDHAFFDEHGRTVSFQAVGRDITDRRHAEVALQTANRELGILKDRLEAQNTYLQEELTASDSVGDMIYRSPIMRQVLAQAQRVSATRTTVLILGETGVGKEVLARAIHRTSDRHDRPLIRLNCATLPANLIESELFGHERGAFTGAASRLLGRFEVADGATLFLDEIGELPLELQAKLLRVLQEGEFERLGSSRTIKVDVRLIAATSRNLPECIQKGTFRADLYYRLNVFPITLPPLRLRPDDIVPLATVFLARLGQRVGKSLAPINKAVADALVRHPWPGNVRELENVIERAVVSSQGTVLQLPEGWDGKSPISTREGLVDAPSITTGRDVTSLVTKDRQTLGSEMSIRELERAHIMLVLERTKWRIEGPDGAAVILGVKPSTLRFRMKKLAISRNLADTPR
jgi:PAS domain S-box-containing protein